MDSCSSVSVSRATGPINKVHTEALIMAGGRNAEFMACMECLNGRVLTKATRVYEGTETDQYVCEKGHHFGFTFPKGPPKEPEWPPRQEWVDNCK